MGAYFRNCNGKCLMIWSILLTLIISVKAITNAELPGQPTNLQARINGNSITVTWTPPKEQPNLITSYTISWGVNVPDDHYKIVNATRRSYTIEDIRPLSEYVISVRASNAAGPGNPKYVSIWTKQSTRYEQPLSNKPILPPVGLKAIVTSSKSITVTWSDTSLEDDDEDDADKYSLNAGQRRYSVQYTSNLHSYNPKYQYCNTTELSCVIDNLKPNTQYEFAVKVYIGHRESTWSMSVTNTTSEALPASPPRDLTMVPVDDDSSTVNVHWQPPKAPNGQLTGYTIYYTHDNRLPDSDWSVESVDGEKLTATIRNLLPDTSYYFKILAKNNRGSSPLSKETSFTTLPDMFRNSVSSAENKSVTQSTFYLIIITISITTIILFIIIVIFICKRSFSKNNLNNKRKGYTATATSPAINSKKSSRNELKPPDLWINHDHIELKGLDKSDENSSIGTPISRNHNEKNNCSINYSDGHYDDVHKDTIETTSSMTIVCGTSTARRNARAKPVVIPVDSQQQPQSMQPNNVINFEPSTGLSRPIYPITQYNIQQQPQQQLQQQQQHRAHVTLDNHDGISNPHFHHHHHLYDPVASPSLNLGLSVGATNSGILTSNNVSYSSGSGLTSPKSNTLSKRMLGQNPLKSFSAPSPPNTQSQTKHIVVRPQMSTSPQKKMFGNAFTSKPLITDHRTQIVTPSTPHFNITEALKKEDDVMSTYSTEELNQEINNLEGLMKDLNAITASDFETNH